MSSHDEIQDLIPDFAAGRASHADRQLVEAHLRDCAECRGYLEECVKTAADLRELAIAVSAQHPEPDQFALFTDSALTGEQLRAFELHLDLCAKCSEKLATIRQLEREVQYEVAPPANKPRHVSPAHTGFRRFIARPVWIYGVAIAAVVLLAVPVMRSLLEPKTPVNGSGAEMVVQLAEQTRSGLSRRSITLSSEQTTLVLEIRFIPLLDRTYSITVVTDAGEAIQVRQLSAEEVQQGTVAVRISAKEMTSGDYSAVLTSTPADGEPLSVYYPFTIKR
jgi:anti-sigma factor RsiW